MKDLETVLDELLASWRESRAPAVADAIDRVSDALVPSEKPILSNHEWIVAADEEKRPARYRVVLDLVARHQSTVRIDAIRRDDPRAGTIARTWLAALAGPSTRRHIFYSLLFRNLEELEDVRVLPELEALARDPKLTHAICHRDNAAKLTAAIAKLAAVQPKEPDRALIARADETIAKTADRDPAALFAAVYADPADDAARAVLADLLTERGDVRGEFISLQLARHGKDVPVTDRERSLFKTWKRRWLGWMEPGIAQEGVAFARGFVDAVRTGRTAALESTFTAPEWATVRELDLRGTNASDGYTGEFFKQASLPNLRAVFGLSLVDLATLRETGRTFPWEEVGFSLRGTFGMEAIRDAPFPNAKALSIEELTSQALDQTADQILALVAPWKALEALTVEIDTRAMPDLLAHPDAARFENIQFTTKPRLVDWKRSERRLALCANVFNDDEALIEAELVHAIKPAKVIIATRGPAKLKGEIMTWNKNKLNVGPIMDAAGDVDGECEFWPNVF